MKKVIISTILLGLGFVSMTYGVFLIWEPLCFIWVALELVSIKKFFYGEKTAPELLAESD